MAKQIQLYKSSRGINTKTSPHRLKIGANCDLAYGVNIDIDNSGQIKRRKGFKSTSITDSSHSIFSYGNTTLAVIGGSLCKVASDYTATLLVSNVGSSHVSYCGINTDIYIKNPNLSRIYNTVNQTIIPWEVSAYSGIETSRSFGEVPSGEHIDWFNGRMFISKGSVLFYSEPFVYNWFDYARNFFMFSHPIKVLRSVKTGLYVCTERELFFITGESPKEYVLNHKGLYHPIEWTDVVCNSLEIGAISNNGTQLFTDDVLIFTSLEGILLCGNNGNVINVTEKKVDLPSGQVGTAFIVDGNYKVFYH